MKTSFRALALVSLLACAVTSRAADAPPTEVHAQSTAPSETMNLDFPGGSIAQLVLAVSKSSNPINVIGEPADLATEIPAISVRNADAGVLVAALSDLLESRGLTVRPIARGRNTVFVVRKITLPPRQGRPDDPEFISYQLAPYLEFQTIDDIVAAMRSAWELDPAHSPGALRLKFHAPTKLLLVSGPAEAISITRYIMGGLKASVPDKAKATANNPAPPNPPEKK